MRCASCGFENPAGFRFCGHCASPLAGEAGAPAARAPGAYTLRHLAEKAEKRVLQVASVLGVEFTEPVLTRR